MNWPINNLFKGKSEELLLQTTKLAKFEILQKYELTILQESIIHAPDFSVML